MSSPVLIVKYDPQWSILYEAERHHILQNIGHKVQAIEHIGSTAVPNLGSKPIIDIMVGVPHPTDAEECVPLLQDLDYRDVTPQPGDPDWYYCLGKTYRGETASLQNYHLHLVRFMSDHWKIHLLFRDFLRAHPDVAEQYYELKKELAAKYGSDRIGYTNAKTSFIESVIARADASKVHL